MESTFLYVSPRREGCSNPVVILYPTSPEGAPGLKELQRVDDTYD